MWLIAHSSFNHTHTQRCAVSLHTFGARHLHTKWNREILLAVPAYNRSENASYSGRKWFEVRCLMINIFLCAACQHFKFRKQFQFHIAPSCAGAEPKQNKTNVKRKKEEKNSMLKILRFSVAHFSNIHMHVCVYSICVCMRRVLGSFVGSFFTSILHFGRCFLRILLATSWLMMAYGMWNGRERERHTPPPSTALKTILFARDWRLFVQLHIEMFAMYSSLVLKSEKKVNPMPKQLSDCGTEFMNISGH